MNVGVLIYHHVNELDVVTPIGALDVGRRLYDDPEALTLATVARSRLSVQTAAGLTLTPTWAFASAPQFDVLVIPGGPGIAGPSRDAATRAFLDKQLPGLRVLAAVGSGPLLLGRYGLLRDRSVTAHPDVLEQLREFEPGEIRRARLVRDDQLWTASTPSAAIDLALALLAELLSSELVPAVAERLGHPTDLA